MPHQCTNCEEVYKDGSDAILDGCEGCGGNKFQFVKPAAQRNDLVDADAVSSNEDEVQKDARTQMVSKSELSRAERRREYEEERQQRETADAQPEADTNRRQKRPVTEEDLPSDPPMSVEQDVSKIKDSLNTQFEGIRVVEQGKYEINLTQLFERNTQVISVQEDGKYIINVPETFESAGEDEEEN